MPSDTNLEKLIINKNLTKERFEQAIADGSIGENDFSFVDDEDTSTTIDAEMSDTSKNPVQNGVIKAYIDKNIGNKVDRSEADYVVETYQNGTNWYRVYKSGWVEQGGTAKATGSTTNLTLLKPFADTNYWCLSNMISSDTGNAHTNYMYATPVSTTTMKFGAYQSGSTVRWYACGKGV